MTDRKIRVGQIVYSVNRRNIEEHIVSYVGNKYFEIKDMPNKKILIDTMRDKINVGMGYSIQTYLTKQEIVDMLQRYVIEINLKYFNYSQLTLDQLKRIKGIIDE